MLDFILVNSGVGAGGAGAATANTTSAAKMTGLLLGFQIRYNDSPPGATTDVTVDAVGSVLPNRNLLTITDAATDGFFAVRAGAVTTANSAITNSHAPIPLVNDQIKVTIAQANDGDNVDVWAVVEK